MRASSSSPTATRSTPAGAARRATTMACGSMTARRPGVLRGLAGMAAWYMSNPLVAGMDIMNEPRRSRVGGRVLTPTWGTGSKTDIAAMYTAVGNLIHEVSPDLLIICEGLGFAADLTGVARHPVRLERPGKVVYSLHDYSWFHPAGQPRPAYFDQMHAKPADISSTDGHPPLWIGEFGNARVTGSVSASRRQRRPGGGTTRGLAHRAGRGLVLVAAPPDPARTPSRSPASPDAAAVSMSSQGPLTRDAGMATRLSLAS